MRIGREERVALRVNGQGHGRQGQLLDQLARGQVVDEQGLTGAHVEPFPVALTVVGRWPPARLEHGVLHGHGQFVRARDLVATSQPDTPGHGVLGQMWVGELVDVVGLAVLPVLQELGGGAGVVDLVEVHAHRLVEPEATHAERDDDQQGDDQQVPAVDAPPGFGSQPGTAVAAQ